MRNEKAPLHRAMQRHFWRRWWDSNPRARLRTKRFRVVLVTTTSIHLPIHFALQSGGQKLPEPLDSPIIITKFPLSVNWFSSASAGYIFKGCAASCERAAVSLRLHLTDAVISGNVSKLGKSLTIWPGSFSRRERFWNEWSRRGRQKRESNL